jgi:hypothetical protein
MSRNKNRNNYINENNDNIPKVLSEGDNEIIKVDNEITYKVDDYKKLELNNDNTFIQDYKPTIAIEKDKIEVIKSKNIEIKKSIFKIYSSNPDWNLLITTYVKCNKDLILFKKEAIKLGYLDLIANETNTQIFIKWNKLDIDYLKSDL